MFLKVMIIIYSEFIPFLEIVYLVKKPGGKRKRVMYIFVLCRKLGNWRHCVMRLIYKTASVSAHEAGMDKEGRR